MTIAQIYLAVLLALMALGQAVSRSRFDTALLTYGLTRTRLWGVAIITLEALAAALLVPSSSRIAGAALALLVATAWTLLASKALLERRTISNCGCFGGYLPQPLRWWVLLEDIAFIGLAAFALAQAL